MATTMQERDDYQMSELRQQHGGERPYPRAPIRTERHCAEIIGHSYALKSVLKQIEMVAPTDATVLIHGETGTGKELIARALHTLSTRGAHNFVTLNCAAIPLGLLETELFGHEKGAFTGALMQHIGRFELAHTGTLFLDEIGDLPLELQPKLLRVLQEQEFERIGSSRTVHTDVRLVAATHRDLFAMVHQQQFRDDLYYRLNIFPITVPPLRDRREDIPLLVHHFAHTYAHRMHKRIEPIPADAMADLVHYDWPGNVRELQNVIERAVILSLNGVLRPPLPPRHAVVNRLSTLSPRSKTLDDVMREHILEALRSTNGVLAGPNGAAARLGMKRSTPHQALACPSTVASAGW